MKIFRAKQLLIYGVRWKLMRLFTGETAGPYYAAPDRYSTIPKEL
jgi:hypothetical protein